MKWKTRNSFKYALLYADDIDSCMAVSLVYWLVIPPISSSLSFFSSETVALCKWPYLSLVLLLYIYGSVPVCVTHLDLQRRNQRCACSTMTLQDPDAVESPNPELGKG